MSDGFLHRYFLANGHKPLLKWVHYFDIYERHFERFRGKSPVMVEIGVAYGGSVRMWKDYFGPGARIVGIDVMPAFKAHEEDGVEILIGSQDDPAFLATVLEKYPEVDIVLDDGSHMMAHMRASFNFLYPRLSPNGVYMVEDLHTCYWPEFGGGLRDQNSFIELVKTKIDDLNAVHSRDGVPVSDFTRSTHAICCYDSIVAFEKRPQGVRLMPNTGPM